MTKHQFNIGTRTLNFEGTKKQATESAKEWQTKHPEHIGVQYIKQVFNGKPKTTLHKMYKGGK